jgi:hypothetical protein
VQEIAVAALRDVASKPVVVLGLLLNWNEQSAALLRSMRGYQQRLLKVDY